METKGLMGTQLRSVNEAVQKKQRWAFLERHLSILFKPIIKRKIN